MGCKHQPHQGKEYIIDIETNGLLDDVTKVHCLVLKDIRSNVIQTFSNDINCNGAVEQGIELINNAELIVGHNIIKYDLPVLRKIYPRCNDLKNVFDTLVASRLIWSDLRDLDAKSKVNAELLAHRAWGSHALKAWGIRLGNHKAEIDTDWSVLTKEMLDYCIQDVEVTHLLYQKILDKKYSEQALKLEHDVAKIIGKQERYGIMFDVNKGKELHASLSKRRSEIKTELQKVFPPLEKTTIFVPKVNNKKQGYVKGKRVRKVELVDFNPSSRQHIANRLKYKGWKPKEFTPDGSPKVDDKVLNELDFPEAKLLAEYFLLEKRIGMLAEGQQAYLKLEREGRLHGSVNTNGAVTGRSTASSPNLQQVPAVYAPYGKEFRELFTVPDNHSMVGVDMSGIEVRCLAHFLTRYDNGEYSKIVLEGDIHTANQEAAGLETRDLAKRFFYCWLYGGGVGKIAEVTGKSVKEAKKVKERFLNRMPALAKLIEQVRKSAERGYLIGLDKRVVKVRNTFSALNTLLQSAGALCAKQWLVEFNEAMYGQQHVKQLLWVHDEIQIQCPNEYAQYVGEEAVDCIKRAGQSLNMRIPLDGEFKIGTNWSETH